MTIRRPVLFNNEFYHLYNKSIADTVIIDNKTLYKALEIIDYYRFNQRLSLSAFNKLININKINYLKEIKSYPPLIDISSFSLMPNHHHFLVKQLQDSGIKNFISNFQNSFAKNFNLINKRQGSLFLNSFKFKRIKTEEEFLHVCRYIHLNHVTSRLNEFDELANYPFSSYCCYLNKGLNKFVNTDLIWNHFKSKENFIKFHREQVNHQRKLRDIKKLLIDA